MHRQLSTALACACALACALAIPAFASAATLTLTNMNGDPAAFADFESSYTWVNTPQGSYQCGGIALPTEITQNGSDPVTLQLGNRPWHYLRTGSMGGCQLPNGSTIAYSNLQVPDPMEFNADGTGTLPLRFNQTWTVDPVTKYNCVREGVLDLTYVPNDPHRPISYSGWIYTVSGVCPSGLFAGHFDSPTEDHGPIDFVVTP
jgi:hypothetical protein